MSIQRTIPILFAGALLASSPAARAQEPGSREAAIAKLCGGSWCAWKRPDPSGYAADASGAPLRSGSGQCVRTSSWSEANRRGECDGPDPDPLALAERSAPEIDAPPCGGADEPAAQAAAAPSEGPAGGSAALAFATGEWKLSAPQAAGVAKFASRLAELTAPDAHPRMRVARIAAVGTADSRGGQAANGQLALLRASSALEALLDGLPRSALAKLGHGDISISPSLPPDGEQCSGLRGKALGDCLGPNRIATLEVGLAPAD